MKSSTEEEARAQQERGEGLDLGFAMATSLDDVGLDATEEARPAFAGGNGNRMVERGKEAPSTGIEDAHWGGATVMAKAGTTPGGQEAEAAWVTPRQPGAGAAWA